MLYYLFEYLEKQFQFPGATLFGFLTFRAALAMILSLLISTIYGKRIIRFLLKQQVGETVRDLGLEGQKEKNRHANYGRYHYYFSHFNSCTAIGETGEYIYHSFDSNNALDGNHWVY